MVGRNSHLSILAPVALTSLLLLGLGAVAAGRLYQEQEATAEAVAENIGSRRAAADLEATLQNLIALHRNHAAVLTPLQDRVEENLTEIRRLADKPQEQALASELTTGFENYRRSWQAHPAGAAATQQALAVLEGHILPLCRELRDFNSRQIEESARVHRAALDRTLWGLAGVGTAGALAGLLLGYAAARGLARSIHRLQVHVVDAANKLGQELPPVLLTGGGALESLHGQLQGLVRQVEEVVARLHQREREVRRADQLAAVGRLAAGVAHELRNPLTSIKLLAQAGLARARNQETGKTVLLTSGSARGLDAEDLEVIEREVRRLERSLQSFLDFARPPKPERAILDLRQVVDRTCELVRGRAARQRVELHGERPDAPVWLSADAGQLQQVLINLALNALDAMPAGGVLTLALSVSRPGEVELTVRDTGPGIAAAMLPRLFEPFASDKETGLGLGLAVSRRIVEDHGGTLEAANRPGGGACFTILLPRDPELAAWPAAVRTPA